VRVVALILLSATTVFSAEISAPEALANAGHYLRLKALEEPVVKAHPEDSDALYWLALAEGALGNLDASVKFAEQAVAIDPKNAHYHALLAGSCGRVAQTAGLLKQMQFGRRAKKELDAAMELDPNEEGALYGLALFYHAAPAILGGDKQKSQAAVDLLTKLNPVRGFVAQAKLAHERKDAAAEEEAFKNAVAANPRSYEAKVKLGNFYLTRNLPAAWQLAREAQEIDPTQAEAWKLLAQVYVALQCWDELRAVLVDARAAVPDDLAPYYYSAIALEQSGHFLGWASEFLDLYMSAPPEGEEPTLEEAQKAVKRLKSAAVHAE
jgi:tetratricopeptide (TPR) repeat protein